MSVTEIAERLGYSSLYAFSRTFKEAFGTSPKQYAKLSNGRKENAK